MRRTRANRSGLTLLELLVVLTILISLGTLIIPTVGYFGQRSQKIATLENMRRLRELIVNKYIPNMDELPRPGLPGLTIRTPPRQDHPQLCYLFVNPDYHEDGVDGNDHDMSGNLLSTRSWQGPYPMHSGAEYYVLDADGDPAMGNNFTSLYGEGDESTGVGDPTVIDAWGRPIVLQQPEAGDPPDVTDEDEYKHARLVSAGRDGIIDTPPDKLMPTDDDRNDDLVLFLFRHDEYGEKFLDLKQKEEWR